MKKEPVKLSPATTPPATNQLELSRWIGRREAFGIIAGRCSAAEVGCLRRIREEKLWRGAASSWDQFCAEQLKASRKKIDTAIRHLEEFGPAFFDLTQLARVTVDEFRAIREHVGPEGIRVDGEVVALLPENSGRIAEAMTKLRKKIGPKPEPAVTFDDALKSCEKAAARLQALEERLDGREKLLLAAAVAQVRESAARLGVVLVEVPRN